MIGGTSHYTRDSLSMRPTDIIIYGYYTFQPNEPYQYHINTVLHSLVCITPCVRDAAYPPAKVNIVALRPAIG